MLDKAGARPQVEDVGTVDQRQNQKHRRTVPGRTLPLVAVQVGFVLAPHQLARRHAHGRIARRQDRVHHIKRATVDLGHGQRVACLEDSGQGVACLEDDCLRARDAVGRSGGSAVVVAGLSAD